MDKELNIKGFKCFLENKFNLKKINVLTGNNGAGKSSFIQAILLMRIIVEKKGTLKNGYYEFNDGEEVTTKVNLNNKYCLNLGTEKDVFNNEDTSKINLKFENDEFELSLNETSVENLSLKSNNKITNNPSPIKKDEFYYLNSERIGPRNIQKNKIQDFYNCGFKGEYTANTISKLELDLEYESALLKKGTKFNIELNKWVNFIFPNVSITTKDLSNLYSRISLSVSNGKSDLLSTNIGFGISYALPIIVNGLIAKKDSLFIIENPEAHLHPKAQSNIGAFLAYLSTMGVNLIIETHSEHVINGIRKAILFRDDFKADDVNIFFFKELIKGNVNYDEIKTDERGNLSLFPVDFFDQSRQDLNEIRNIVINGEAFNFF